MTKVPFYQDEWVTLSFDDVTNVVRYTRSDVPYRDLTDMDRSHAGLAAVAPQLLPGMKLLMDVWLAPPRNDGAFETKTNAALDVFLLFAKHATLVRTAVGKLQTARLARERGTAAYVFDDEAEALAYLGVGKA